MDMPVFFTTIKPLFGNFTQSQVDGLNERAKAFEKAGWLLSWAAYALATSYHETKRQMQPVREAFWLSENWRKANLRYYPYYGRGDVQLTWPDNYKWADDFLGLNGALIKNPDLALKSEYSVPIMIEGMSKGRYTGKKLSDYLTTKYATKIQFTNSRRIVNLMDKAEDIADVAMIFQDALIKAGFGNV